MIKDIAILIPALNEEKNIAGIVKGLKNQYETVIVVDDGSTDRTGILAKENGAFLLTHKTRRGKGEALKTGFSHAVSCGIDAVLTMDGDGQHLIADVKRFENAYRKNKNACVWVGKRKIKGTDMPLIRRMTNISMSLIISSLAGQWIPDTQCGFRLIKREVIEKIRLITSNFETESELLIKSGWKGFRIASVTISTVYSDEKSKINPTRDTMRFFGMLAVIIFPLLSRIKRCKKK